MTKTPPKEARVQVNLDIIPFTVPESVTVMMGSARMEVQIKDLPDETLLKLVDEFAQRVFEMNGKTLTT